MVLKLVAGLNRRDRTLQPRDHLCRDDLVDRTVVHEGVRTARERSRRTPASDPKRDRRRRYRDGCSQRRRPLRPMLKPIQTKNPMIARMISSAGSPVTVFVTASERHHGEQSSQTRVRGISAPAERSSRHGGPLSCPNADFHCGVRDVGCRESRAALFDAGGGIRTRTPLRGTPDFKSGASRRFRHPGAPRVASSTSRSRRTSSGCASAASRSRSRSRDAP